MKIQVSRRRWVRQLGAPSMVEVTSQIRLAVRTRPQCGDVTLPPRLRSSMIHTKGIYGLASQHMVYRHARDSATRNKIVKAQSLRATSLACSQLRPERVILRLKRVQFLKKSHIALLHHSNFLLSSFERGFALSELSIHLSTDYVSGGSRLLGQTQGSCGEGVVDGGEVMQILGLFSGASFDFAFLCGDAFNGLLKLVKLILPVVSILISHRENELDRL